jgi:hypothetical protein
MMSLAAFSKLLAPVLSVLRALWVAVKALVRAAQRLRACD